MEEQDYEIIGALHTQIKGDNGFDGKLRNIIVKTISGFLQTN